MCMDVDSVVVRPRDGRASEWMLRVRKAVRRRQLLELGTGVQSSHYVSLSKYVMAFS